MFLTLAAMIAAQSHWDDPAPKGRWAASTQKLAAELLPPEWAADAVSHVVSRGILQGGPPSSVRFEGRPVKTGDGFCTRKSYYVSISGPYGSTEGEPRKPIVADKVRLGECDGIFAHVNPGASFDGAKRALRWLEWARSEARSDRPLSFSVRCRDETQGGKCAVGGRAALASLPSEKSFLVTDPSNQPHVWKVAITGIRDQLIWDVTMDATSGNPSIDMVWKVPAPF